MNKKDLNQIVILETEDEEFEIRLKDIYNALKERGYTIIKDKPCLTS
jgi:uncharacterized protein (UPF0297 family)